MLLRDIFETKIEEKIDPVIKVGERHNERKLAEEIGSYVVTPTIEKFLDDFLEHYTDTFRNETGEIGIWISGYFGSGRSHLAKIFSLLVENPSWKVFRRWSGLKRASLLRRLIERRSFAVCRN